MIAFIVVLMICYVAIRVLDGILLSIPIFGWIYKHTLHKLAALGWKKAKKAGRKGAKAGAKKAGQHSKTLLERVDSWVQTGKF